MQQDSKKVSYLFSYLVKYTAKPGLLRNDNDLLSSRFNQKRNNTAVPLPGFIPVEPSPLLSLKSFIHAIFANSPAQSFPF